MLETTRLIVRPVAASDVDDVHRLLYADPAVSNNWTGLTPARENEVCAASFRSVKLMKRSGFRITLTDQASSVSWTTLRSLS